MQQIKNNSNNYILNNMNHQYPMKICENMNAFE